MRRPWVIGHRGAPGHAPENTIASFRRAVELGAAFIETDLRLSHDARFVAMHDPTVDRTTDGKGLVRELTLAELRELDAGSWYGKQFAGERIPSIEEVLMFARDVDVVAYLEVKIEDAWGVHHALVSALRAANETARAVIISFDATFLDNVRRLDTTLLTGFLYEPPMTDAIEKAQRIGVRQILPRADLVTPELVAAAHAADLQIATWTVDDPKRMCELISADVNGIMTNYPDRLGLAIADCFKED
ncbi:MAG TPA: glycerophosphodiester phosphodiesterase family protein [Candidatus Acidoferrales bacterium]|nr:glycerophosphodiester phosphodiesterase family protein [Candidatus Acidoferrales bacterium]